MVKEAPGQLNFTMFLSLFSEKLSGEYWRSVTYTARGAREARGARTRNV